MPKPTKTKTKNSKLLSVKKASKPQTKKLPKSTNWTSQQTKQTICYTIFLLAWVGLSLIASQYLVSFIMAVILGQEVEKPLWTLVFYILSFALTLALVFLLPPKLWQLLRARQQTAQTSTDDETEDPFAATPEEVGVKTPPTFTDIGLAPIAYIVYTLVAGVIIEFMNNFSWFNAEQAQDVGFSYFVTAGDRILAMIAIVLVAPIAEELIMRGWLYGKLRNRLKAWLAILLTSLLFGLLHGQWNVAVSTFILSVVMCGLREITGTIWSGMLLHILSNGIAFYILYIAV